MIQTTLNGFDFVLYETGRIRITQRNQEVFDEGLLLPWLVPPFINRSDPSDDEGAGIAPVLEEGSLQDEGIRYGRQHYRLIGIMRHPLRSEHRFLYEALFHLGAEPLFTVEYVRLRTSDGAVRLTHWEHHFCLPACRAVLFSGLSQPWPTPIFDLVLLHNAQAPVLAAQDGDRWLLVASRDLAIYKQGALTLRSDPQKSGLHHLGLHRISPDWAYSGAIHQTLEPVDLAAGAALSFSFSLDI